MQPEDYDTLLLFKKFAIFKSKIFYFYKDTPYPEGILEAEDLLDEEERCFEEKS